MSSEPVGDWHGDSFEAHDGRNFVLFSELIRGEPRYYEVKEFTRRRGENRWNPPVASGYDKRSVKRGVERYVREHPKSSTEGTT